MAKEDAGRLLSKVAKFVRNPLKDWSELDGPESGTSEAGYSREVLKEMIERRQRNDFVRRREFDMLRKLRRREVADANDASAQSSSFDPSATGRNAGRALTLKKIDEIEAQMSQQWWKGGRQAHPGADGAAIDSEGPIDSRHPDDIGPGSGAGTLSRLAAGSALDEAAVRFAHGDDGGTEAILLQALAPDGASADHEETWRALLDFYRAIGDAEKFTAASTRFAQRLKRPGPPWVSLRACASGLRPAGPQAASAARGAAGVAHWVSPAAVTRESLAGMTRALSGAGAEWCLDWRALAAIAPDAVGPLKSLIAHWANSPVQLRFAGGTRLLEVLAAATPTGDRGVEVLWWQLRMEALRLMQRPDDFELAALNYCITYEVSPPPWEEARGRYAPLDTSPAPLHSLELESATEAVDTEVPALVGGSVLAGELSGDCTTLWQQLDAELAGSIEPTISCAALVRIDLVAAGTLLNWVTERDGRGERVEFVGAHRLVTAFFSVIGISDHANVSPRAD